MALLLPLLTAASLGRLHQWHGVAAAVREELGSFYTGQFPAGAQKSFEPYDGSVAANITDIHVIFSNHLDVGFNVRAWCDGNDGCVSPVSANISC